MAAVIAGVASLAATTLASPSKPDRHVTALASNSFHDFLRATLNGAQIGRGGGIGVAPSLLPIFKRGKRNAVQHRKAVLRHMQSLTDCLYVGNLNRRDAKATHFLAAGMRRRLLHARDQFVCELAH